MYGEATRKLIDRSDFVINRKSFDQLNGEAKFNSAYKKINSEIQNKKTLSKTVMEEMYNFTIDSTQINEVLTEKYTSYSFGIIRDSINPNFYENLFIEIDSTDLPQASILKFNINPITKEIISISANFIQYNISVTGKIMYDGPPCNYVTVTTETQCGCVGHWPGQSCSCSQGPTSSTQTYLVCRDDEGGTSGDTWTNTSSESGGGGSGGNSISAPRVLTPREQRIKSFNLQLTADQKQCLNSLDENTRGELMNFLESEMTIDGLILSETSYSAEDIVNAEAALQILCNGGDVDFEKSLKSPAIIDFSAIDTSTPEGQKLDCIYQKLMQSPSFENLFNNTFGGNQTKLNVKFEIADNLPDNIGGVCQLQPPVNGAYTNLIRININHLIGVNAKSNLINARTILHECIHAYLNIKKINCNLGSTIPELNGLDLQSLIGTFYQGFGCHIDVNGSLQSQHDFIFTYLIPSFQNIFSDIYNLLASESNINYVNNSIYNNSLTGENFTWNWNDFFKYYSMEGLHLCDSFVSAIQNVPNENFNYNFYKNEAQNFIKNCQ